jgi:hypothetical protein
MQTTTAAAAALTPDGAAHMIGRFMGVRTIPIA